MKSVTITAVVLLFIVDLSLVKSRPTNPFTTDIQACGRELADLLSATCRHGYNNNAENESENNQEKLVIQKEGYGITRECCHQPCKLRDLLSYCFNGSDIELL